MGEFLIDSVFAAIAGVMLASPSQYAQASGAALAIGLLFNNQRLIRLAVEKLDHGK